MQDADKFAEDDQKNKEKAESRNDLESYVYSLKNQVADKTKLGGKLSQDDKDMIDRALEDSVQWLQSNQDAEGTEILKVKKDLEAIVEPIIARLQGGQRDDKEEL